MSIVNSIISIHALREEGDTYIVNIPLEQGDFYPRPPRGGRQPRSGLHGRQC